VLPSRGKWTVIVKNSQRNCWIFGATTIRPTTLSIVTLSVSTHSITKPSSIMTFYTKSHTIWKINTPSTMAGIISLLSITMPSMITHSISALSIMTNSTIISITAMTMTTYGIILMEKDIFSLEWQIGPLVYVVMLSVMLLSVVMLTALMPFATLLGVLLLMHCLMLYKILFCYWASLGWVA
jgi:hypothetical protein